uniref:Uncharacterized protein n=1 Tax=Downy mildew lesion associated ormycovirus 2 TaxID=3162770 RepID=A0AAU8BRU2_9VIRU
MSGKDFDPAAYLKRMTSGKTSNVKITTDPKRSVKSFEHYGIQPVTDKVLQSLNLTPEDLAFKTVSNDYEKQFIERFFTYEQKHLSESLACSIHGKTDVGIKKLLNFKGQKSFEKPPISNTASFALPSSWFEFRGKITLSDELSSKKFRELRPVYQSDKFENVLLFANDLPINEALRENFPVAKDIVLEDIPIFSEEDLHLINERYIKLLPFLMYLTASPKSSFIELIVRENGKLPYEMMNWVTAPNTRELRDHGCWTDHSIPLSYGPSLIMLETDLFIQASRISTDLKYVLNVLKLLYFVNHYQFPKEIYLDDEKISEIKRQFPSEFFESEIPYAEEQTQIYKSMKTIWTDETPRFSIKDQIEGNDQYLNYLESGLNGQEYYRGSLIQTAQILGPTWVPIEKNFLDIYNLRDAENRTTENLLIAQEKQRIETQKFNMAMEVKRYLYPEPLIDPAEVDFYQMDNENDFFDDEEGGFFGFDEFEQNLSEGMHRDLTDGEAGFPWDPGGS